DPTNRNDLSIPLGSNRLGTARRCKVASHRLTREYEVRDQSSYLSNLRIAHRYGVGVETAVVRHWVIVEVGSPEVGFGFQMPDLPGCVADSPSRASALGQIRSVATDYLNRLGAAGLPWPTASSQQTSLR